MDVLLQEIHLRPRMVTFMLARELVMLSSRPLQVSKEYSILTPAPTTAISIKVTAHVVVFCNHSP